MTQRGREQQPDLNLQTASEKDNKDAIKNLFLGAAPILRRWAFADKHEENKDGFLQIQLGGTYLKKLPSKNYSTLIHQLAGILNIDGLQPEANEQYIRMEFRINLPNQEKHLTQIDINIEKDEVRTTGMDSGKARLILSKLFTIDPPDRSLKHKAGLLLGLSKNEVKTFKRDRELMINGIPNPLLVNRDGSKKNNQEPPTSSTPITRR